MVEPSSCPGSWEQNAWLVWTNVFLIIHDLKDLYGCTFLGFRSSAVAMPECSLEGLASEWDSDESVREDLRLGKPLIAEVSEKQVDIQMPSKYNRLLLPVLARMRMAAKKLPSIDSFRSEIRAIMTKNKRDPSDEDVDKFSWLIRKNCGFVKMKCRRQEVSNAA